MKKVKYLIILFMAAMYASCESWLDVSPRAELKEDDQFSTERGFKDAVYGVYTLMTSESLYGDYLTMGMLSALSHDYYYSKIYAGPLQKLITYKFDEAVPKTYFENIWNKAYSVIAHTNYILKNVDEQKGVMSEEVYQTIKGEMLGLRAYLHFDLLRMFAPAYSETADSCYLPYRDEFGVKPAAPITMKEFAARVSADIDQSLEYLQDNKEIDQLNTYIDNEGDFTDDFLLYRQNRFNYYACKGLEARFALWTGDLTRAAEAAREVIDSQKFHFITTSEANATGSAQDRVFTPELVFALYDSELKDRADEYFSEQNSTLIQYRLPSQASYLKYDLFMTTSGGSSDLRYLKQFSAATSGYCFTTKYLQDETIDDAIRNQIPLIRLGEMYLIVAEATSDPSYVNEIQLARALTPNVTADNLTTKIKNEMAKETYAEGQLFFMYKRMGEELINYFEPQYTFTAPDDELIYGEY